MTPTLSSRLAEVLKFDRAKCVAGQGGGHANIRIFTNGAADENNRCADIHSALIAVVSAADELTREYNNIAPDALLRGVLRARQMKALADLSAAIEKVER